MRAKLGTRESLALRSALLAWILVTLLFVIVAANPHAASASVMQLHGALNREGILGIISHRGAAAIAPENTLTAMRVAFEQDVEFVEADVQLTADGVPILIHDPTLDRTTNGSGPIAAHTLAEIKALDAGSWFGAEFAGETIPTLEEFVEALEPTTTRALIELKGIWQPEQVEALVEFLRSHYLVNRVALQSFELPTLEMLRETAPEFARVMLTREWDDVVAEQAVALQVSAVGARTKLFDRRPDLIEQLRTLGIGSLVYTLNSERGWTHAAEAGFDLVVTDDPVSLAGWQGR